MQPRRLCWTLAAANDALICASQTPGGAGNLTLTTPSGVSLANGDPTALTGGCSQRRVLLTFAASEVGHNFTIYGNRAKDAWSKSSDTYGPAISETIAGTGIGTVQSLQDFAIVTRVAIDAAATGAIKVGTNGVGSSPWILTEADMLDCPFNVGLGIVLVSGAANFDIEHTFDKLPRGTSLASPNNALIPSPIPHSSITGKSATIDGNYAFPISAFRLKTNSGTGLLKLGYMQAGVRGN